MSPPRRKARAPGAPSKASYHHGDLRAALLSAAAELLLERGVEGLSLRECARRVGVSHAAPYRHFADKAALIAALAGQGFAWLTGAGRAAIAPLEDPLERLHAYGVAYVLFAHAHPEHHRIMFASEVDPAAGSPEDSAAADAAFELLLECAAPLALPGEDEMLAAFAFWSQAHGLSMLLIDGRIPDDRVSSEEAIAALARAVFSRR